MKNILSIFLLLSLHSLSQAPDCTLKDPAVTIHFGSGSVSDVNTVALSNYNRVRYSCPSDGHYTYTSYTNDCFGGDWWTLSEDHTAGDVNGNMMLVNASYNSGTFFNTSVNGLKGSTTYELSMWLMNVCKPSEKCPFPLLPNITVTLQTPSGSKVAQFSTGPLPRREAPRWRLYRARFTTPSSFSSLKLIMTNSSPGGCGNDFALDDIKFQECVKITPVSTSAAKKPTVTKKPTTVAKPTPEKKMPPPVKKQEPVVITAVKKETIAPPKDTVIVKRKQPVFPTPPAVLRSRTNLTAKQIDTEAGEILLALYDNGEIDGDTVSIYHNNKLVVSHAKLSQKPISLRITIDADNPYHELTMVAENLGSIPPNTSVMIVTAGSKRYQVLISSTEQKNAKVVFNLIE